MDASHLSLTSAATWSVLVRDVATGATLFEHASQRPLSTASVPKLLVLVTCAALIERDELDAGEVLDRASVPPVGDSGLWQHLDQATLTVADAAALVGAVSDNLATNVLLARVGLDVVERESARFGAHDVQLHDRVRDERDPTHPPRLSTASAVGLVDLLAALADDGPVQRRVLGWMRHSTDLSLVASAFGRDPLAHGSDASGMELFSKTGSDAGVRADAGLVRTAQRTIGYAAIANWQATPGVQDGVLASMRHVGELVRSELERA